MVEFFETLTLEVALTFLSSICTPAPAVEKSWPHVTVLHHYSQAIGISRGNVEIPYLGTGFLHRKYRYNSVATLIHHDPWLAPIPY